MQLKDTWRTSTFSMRKLIHPDTRPFLHRDIANLILAVFGASFYSYGAGLAVLLAPLVLSGLVNTYRSWPSAMVNMIGGYLFAYGTYTWLEHGSIPWVIFLLAIIEWFGALIIGTYYRPVDRTKIQRDILNMSASAAAGALLAIDSGFSGFAVLGLPAILSATVAPYRRTGAAYANFIVSMSLFAGFYTMLNPNFHSNWAVFSFCIAGIAIMLNPAIVKWLGLKRQKNIFKSKQ